MRVMAIDYGDAHTGVAVSDPTGFLVGTTTTIDSRRQEVVVDRLVELIGEHRPEEVVLGFPRNMDGTDGRKAELYRELAARLEEAGLPARVVLVNCGEGHHRRPPDPVQPGEGRPEAEEAGGRRGGVADFGELSGL